MHKRLATAAVVGAFAPLLWEWFHYGSDISRLGYVLVCPLLAFVLAWEARTLRRSPQPAPAAAGIAILFAGGLLLLGTIQGMFTIALAGFPVAVAGLLLRQGGWPEFQRLRWSLLCLAAMVPPPLPILDRLIPPLIEGSGHTAVALLAPWGQASWLGSLLTYESWTLLVSEACSGTGSLCVLWGLGIFTLGLARASLWRGFFWLLALGFSTLLVNGIRIALTALALDAWGPSAVQGAAHEWLGQAVVFFAGAVAAILIVKTTPQPAASSTTCSSSAPSPLPLPSWASKLWSISWLALLPAGILTLLVHTGLLNPVQAPDFSQLSAQLGVVELGEEIEVDPSRLGDLPPDRWTFRSIQSPTGSEGRMYFTWYQRGRRWSGRPHDVEICYRALGWEDRAPPIDLKSPGKVQAQVWEFEREGEHLTVTAWQQRPGSSLGSVPFQQTFRQDIFAGYFEFPREGAPSRSELETAAQAAVKEVESLLQPAQ